MGSAVERGKQGDMVREGVHKEEGRGEHKDLFRQLINDLGIKKLTYFK